MDEGAILMDVLPPSTTNNEALHMAYGSSGASQSMEVHAAALLCSLPLKDVLTRVDKLSRRILIRAQGRLLGPHAEFLQNTST